MATPYHPEFLQAIEPMLPKMAQMPKPALHDISARRALADALVGDMLTAIPMPADVELNIHHTKTKDGFSLPIYHYRKRNSTSNGTGPALLCCHGGGYISLTCQQHSGAVATLASATNVQIFAVDYRLAPEHPFPTPVEDCYTGLLWLHEHAKEFNVDTARIATYGESAGGGLAAGLTIMARDRKLSPQLAKQILIYPMLDDRNCNPHPDETFMVWGSEDNITGWTAYVGENVGRDGVSPYAAAARVENVEGLPPTYMDVGTIDYFRDEDILYASRLAAANIPTEFHLYPGLPHAFEMIARGTKVVDDIMAIRFRAITSF